MRNLCRCSQWVAKQWAVPAQTAEGWVHMKVGMVASVLSFAKENALTERRIGREGYDKQHCCVSKRILHASRASSGRACPCVGSPRAMLLMLGNPAIYRYPALIIQRYSMLFWDKLM